MNYIIMSDGKGTRWNNYLGITKQEVFINGERLIDRTSRLIFEKTNKGVYILSSNPKHNNKYSTRIVSSYQDYFHKKYAYDYLDDSTTYLYGDTFYKEETLDIIIKDICEDIIFYGNEKSIIAVKVNNYQLVKKIIDGANNDTYSLYHLFDEYEKHRKFFNVENGFVNINTPDDYLNLIRDEKELVLKR